jgi:hypothetical protein
MDSFQRELTEPRVSMPLHPQADNSIASAEQAPLAACNQLSPDTISNRQYGAVIH